MSLAQTAYGFAIGKGTFCVKYYKNKKYSSVVLPKSILLGG